jgi:hypothetical protein
LPNHLPKELTIRESFLFPLSTPEARKDVLIGGLAVIFLLPIGWILNLGARLDVVNRLYEGEKPYFRGMKPLPHTFKRGCISAVTIFSYLLPANIFWAYTTWSYYNLGWHKTLLTPLMLGLLFFLLGVFTLPGCMTVYACEKDSSVLLNPYKAFCRAWTHRKIYMRAWMISLCSVVVSFFGLLGFFVGFFFTSVWAWEVVGYAFTIAMYSDTSEAE